MKALSCCRGATKKDVLLKRERLHKWSNKKVATCLHLTDLETKHGALLRFVVALTYLTLAGGCAFVWYELGQQLHVVFWVGPLLQVALFVTTLALASSFLLLTRVRIIRYYRFQDVRVAGMAERGNPKRNCDLQLGNLRPMVVISAALALIAVVLGLITIAWGLGIAATFSQPCSLGPDSVRMLEKTSNELVSFQKACHKKEGKDKVLTLCPGFHGQASSRDNVNEASDAASNNTFSGYATYLFELEMHEGCTGFCEPTDSLSLKGRRKAPVDKLSCADVVGEYIHRATLLVGVPSIVIGISSAIVAFFLFDYDNL